jgi:hypothetical protein
MLDRGRVRLVDLPCVGLDSVLRNFVDYVRLHEVVRSQSQDRFAHESRQTSYDRESEGKVSVSARVGITGTSCHRNFLDLDGRDCNEPFAEAFHGTEMYTPNMASPSPFPHIAPRTSSIVGPTAMSSIT